MKKGLPFKVKKFDDVYAIIDRDGICIEPDDYSTKAEAAKVCAKYNAEYCQAESGDRIYQQAVARLSE